MKNATEFTANPVVINVGGQRWLAGMRWASFETVPRRADLEEDGERLKADWVAVRVGDEAIQAGFSGVVPGESTSKLYSIAAMVADSQRQPWLGIYEIADNLWWYIAVRDHHAILPDGDVIGNAEEINAAQARHEGLTDWNKVQGTLDDLIALIQQIRSEKKKLTRVKSLSGGIRPYHVYSAIAAGLVITAGVYVYQQKQEQEERARIQAQMRLKLAAANQPQLPPSPMLTTPPPDNVIQACARIAKTLPLSMYGWKLGPLECSQTSVTVPWLRTPAATVNAAPNGEVSSDGEKVLQSIPNGVQQTGVDNAADLHKEERMLRGWAQSVGVGLNLSADVAPTALPGAKEANAPPPQPQTRVRIDLQYSPFKLSFNAVPGFRITRLSETSTGGWAIEGVLYGRR